MKAILLAGGQGTRLRPLTLHTPKPVVPIFDRPFLHYQIDRIRQVPEIDEVVLSLNYKPDQIERVLGDRTSSGLPLRYIVEPQPLGTGGAIKFAAQGMTDSVVVFNGDVLTEIDLQAVMNLHRERHAKATIVLTPVENPGAYGLVETDPHGNIRRFLEKPSSDQITTNNINAGIYVLEPETFDRIPDDQPWSIERSYFPSLVDRGEAFVAYIYDGYWIDIGTPDKYQQVHRDIMDGRFGAGPFRGSIAGRPITTGASIAQSASVEGPCFIGEGATIAAGARIGRHSVIGAGTHVASNAIVAASILWPDCRVDEAAEIQSAIIGRGCRVGAQSVISAGTVLGDASTVTDYSRV